MDTYTNVRFNRWERRILRDAAVYLAIAFPRINEEMPKQKRDRNPDHRARILRNLAQPDPTVGTAAAIATAFEVLATLRAAVLRESALDYWLDRVEQDTGIRMQPTGQPTGSYEVYATLAGIRDRQLSDVDRAIDVIERAMRLAVASPADDDDDYRTAPGED